MSVASHVDRLYDIASEYVRRASVVVKLAPVGDFDVRKQKTSVGEILHKSPGNTNTNLSCFYVGSIKSTRNACLHVKRRSGHSQEVHRFQIITSWIFFDGLLFSEILVERLLISKHSVG